MTTSVNKTPDELLESLLADRKVLLFRYDAHLRREIYKKLTVLQKQLINKISAVGVDGVNQRELNRLLKEVKELVTETYNNIGDYSSGELNALLPVETAAVYKIYNTAFKFDLFAPVPEYKIKAIKSAIIVAGSPLNDWWAKQGDDVAFKFSGIIRQGMLDGKQTSQLVTETKELLQGSRRWAETLVRTAVMKVHDKAHEALRDENADIIKGEQQISTLDLRTSDICRVRDGKAWDLNKKPIGHNLPYQRPPLHPNCRSTLRLVVKSWRELGFNADDIPESTRASMDGQVKDNLNYENWLKSKTTEQQDEVLGKGKAELWRKGIITFRDMLDQSGRPLTLKELKELYE